MIRPGSVSVVFLVFSLIIVRVDSVLHPVVNTIYGPIQGFDHISADGHRAEIFLGIPYAKPPVDDLRFEKPQPPDPWPNPFQATRFSRECATYPDFMTTADEEDCLTINIIKPKVPPTDARGYPVMVFVHGGAFLAGSSQQYNYKRAADGLVSRGIIVVTINYRLGFFGFFATGTPEVEGNYGIWDQIEALKFTKKIIADFKGDPQKITVFGESAGGVATSFLSLTPHANGLFQQVIPMSGSAGSRWGSSNRTIETSLKIVKALGCADSDDVKECVKQHSTEDVRIAMSTFVHNIIEVDNTNIVSFNPILNEDLFPGVVSFEDAIQKAERRPNFIGITSQEDALFALKLIPNYEGGKYHPIPVEQAATFTEAQLEEYITAVLQSDPLVPNEDYISTVIDFYRRQVPEYAHNQFFQAYVQFFSDFEFNIPAIREARLKAAAGHPVYFYRFDHAPKFFPVIDGAPHASELGMLFDDVLYTCLEERQLECIKTKADFIDLFVSFAKNGVPSTINGLSPSKVTLSQTPFVAIDSESSVHADLWPQRLAFYNSLFEEHGFDLPSGRVDSNKGPDLRSEL